MQAFLLLRFSVLVKGTTTEASPGSAQVTSTIFLVLTTERTFHSDIPMLHMAPEESLKAMYFFFPQDHLRALNVLRTVQILGRVSSM